MSMRIWHQSFTVLQDLGAYDDALKAHFRRVARPDTEIVMHGMRAGTYRTNYPGNDIRHAGLQHLHSIQFIQAALAAERAADAYAISTLPTRAARIRSCASSRQLRRRHASYLLGAVRRISSSASSPTWSPRRREVRAGASPVLTSAFANDVLRLRAPGSADRPPVQTARQRIAGGAEVLIGRAPLCVLLASQGISSVDGVPVVDSSRLDQAGRDRRPEAPERRRRGRGYQRATCARSARRADGVLRQRRRRG
jgi:hypothetical protein